MKCKSCNGTGKIKTIDFAKQGWKDTEKVCSICHGTGTIEQTNEEWFCQLSTEAKAEVLAQLSSYGGNVGAILDWLKGKHNESV